VAFTVLSNRVGGSDFERNDEDAGVLGAGSTVIKLNVALDANWGDDNNIMDQVNKIATRYGSVDQRADIAKLLSEASLALLRQEASWTSSSYEADRFDRGNTRKAEPLFQQLAIKERSKFERENSPQVALIKSGGQSSPTQAVVSLVVAMRGQSNAFSRSTGPKSVAEVRKVLQTLAAEALTDEGENVMAVEILWTPNERGTTLSEKDLIADYPELSRM